MKIQRLPLMMLCVSLTVAPTTHMARAQTPVPKPVSPPLQVAGSTHHAKGSVELGTCELSSLNGAVLRVAEYWYAATGTNKVDLALPATGGGALDPLTFNSKPLVQGKVLGSVTLAGAGEFDVQWSEPASASRKPWSVSVQNGRTRETMTVYRLLRLEVNLFGVTYVVGTLKTTPVIQFFGAETTKDVGLVTVDCHRVG